MAGSKRSIEATITSHVTALVPVIELQENGKTEIDVNVKATGPITKRRRTGPSFEKLAEFLLEFPSLAAPLTQMFTKASQSGMMDAPQFADQLQTFPGSGDVYMPRDFSDLTLEVVVKDFQLLYSDYYLDNGFEHIWSVKDILKCVPTEVLRIKPSSCFFETEKLAQRYMNRTSEAMCRTMIDLVLLYVLGELSGALPGFPTVRLSGEVSIKYGHQATMKMWSGRLDYALGFEDCGEWYQAVAVCEAKNHGMLVQATGQLVGYLAVLRDCRLRMGRKDTDVFGVTSDGITWTFFSITGVGSLKISPTISSLASGGFEEIFRYLAALIFKALKHHMVFANTDHGNTVDPIVHIIAKEFDEEGNERESG